MKKLLISIVMALVLSGLLPPAHSTEWDATQNRGKNPLMTDNAPEQRNLPEFEIQIRLPKPPEGPSPYAAPKRPSPPQLDPKVWATVEPWMDLRPLITPIAGARISSYDNHLPGAPRAYRKGYHEGLDYYSREFTGVDVRKGTPVYAIADGMVIRSDQNFVEMQRSARVRMLAQQNWRDLTTPFALDLLRGRQLWIRLGGIKDGKSRVARYVHLSSIEPGLKPGVFVKKGQMVGRVGNSGTSNGAIGSQLDMHLHFEFRYGVYEDSYQIPIKTLPRDTFIGYGLKPQQTRKVIDILFSTKDLFTLP